MWKCPKCNQKNRIDVCSKCGYERTKNTSASISALNFVVMAILALALIVGIFFAVDAYIDYNNRQRAKQYEQIEVEIDTENEDLIIDEVPAEVE